MKKRMLSIVLVLALCLTLLPVTALADTVEYYGVRVEDEEVTSSNAADVLGDGTVSYDAVSNTLTLNGADIDAYGYGIDADHADQDLTIKLVGENTIASEDEGGICVGYGNLTITGEGSLTILAEDYYGIYVGYGNLTITGEGSLTILAEDYYGIYVSDGNLTVTGEGALAITAKNDDGVHVYGDVAITCGEVTVDGYYNGIYSYGDVTITCGEVTVDGYYYDGIYSAGDVTISCRELSVDSGDDGIYAKGSVEISDTKMEVNSAYGIYSEDGDIDITDSDLVINALGYAICADDDDGDVCIENTSGLLYHNGYAVCAESSLTVTGCTVEGRDNGLWETITIGSGDRTIGDPYYYVRLITTGETPIAFYDIWVENKMVTSWNAKDVLGDGTVSYDAEDNILTLNGAAIDIDDYGIYVNQKDQELTIKLVGENTIASGHKVGICVYEGDLTITGEGSLSITSEDDSGIYSRGDVTISCGGLMIDSYDDGIYSYGDVTISCGGLIIDSYYDGIYSDGSVTIDQTNVLIDHGCCAVSADDIAVKDCTIEEWTDSGWNEISSLSASSSYKIRLTAKGKAPIVAYDIWVEGNRVTSLNAADVLGDSTVSYDTDDNILTLQDAAVEGLDYECGIYAEQDLTIELVGENTIVSEYYEGIYVEDGDLTITGEGSLSITPEYANGICAEGDVTIACGKLTIDSYYYGIYADGGVEISNTAVVIRNADEYGIYSTDVKISDSDLDIASDYSAAIRAYDGTVYIKNTDGYLYAQNDCPVDSNAGITIIDCIVEGYDSTMGDWMEIAVTGSKILGYHKIRLTATGQNVYVGGVKMKEGDYLPTGSNAVQGDQPTSGGYALLAENTDGELVLTLKDYVYSGVGHHSAVGDNGAIWSRVPLKLVLVGNSKIGLDESNEDNDGIVMYDDLVIEGSGSLTIYAGDDGVEMYDGNLFIQNAGLTVYSYDDGFCVDEGDVEIAGGTLDITADDDGVDSTGDVTVSGGKATIEAGDRGITLNNKLTISGGVVYATGGLNPKNETTEAVSAYKMEMTGGYLLVKNVGTEFADENFEGAIRVGRPEYFSVAGELPMKASCNSSGTPKTDFYVENLPDYNYIEIGEAQEGGSSLPLSGVLGGAAFGVPFADVLPTDWFYDAVQFVYKEGLMNGTSYDNFAPNMAITRAQIVTILWRLEGSPMGAEPSGFSDNDLSSWYGYAVEWAAAFDIVEGANGKFSPNDAITREQLAAILFRYAKYKGYDVWSDQIGLGGFGDAGTVSGYAVEAMQWAVGEGLINGIGEQLQAQGTAVRAQAAAILMRFLSK